MDIQWGDFLLHIDKTPAIIIAGGLFIIMVELFTSKGWIKKLPKLRKKLSSFGVTEAKQLEEKEKEESATD